MHLGILRVHHFPNAHHLRRFVERVAVVNAGPPTDGDPSINQIVLVAFEQTGGSNDALRRGFRSNAERGERAGGFARVPLGRM